MHRLFETKTEFNRNKLV